MTGSSGDPVRRGPVNYCDLWNTGLPGPGYAKGFAELSYAGAPEL
ncbi:MAG: hypothetical protein ABI561_01905 [Bradyrhizobium sp.]